MIQSVTEADKLDELPAHIVAGEAVGDGLEGTALMVTVALPCVPQPQAL